MSQACRDALLHANMGRQAAHAGLLLQRYLTVAVKDVEKKHVEARETLFTGARDAVKVGVSGATGSSAGGVYRAAFQRREEWAERLRASAAVETFPLSTPAHQRLIVGLGNSSTVEVGITLHHTYGVPVLPGSALKGLAAHYCHTALGAKASAAARVLFGDSDDAGHIRFQDAWILPDSLAAEREGLLYDVMTPHHGDYYSGARYGDTAELIPPTDFDEPNPIRFLSIRGTFQFLIICEDTSENGRQWLKHARDLLTQALADWGVGGKTSSGYGRLVEASRTTEQATDPADSHHSDAAASPLGTRHSGRGTTAALPANGTLVEVIVLPERTSKGNLKVRHETSTMEGTVTNSPDVPPSVLDAGRLTVRVTASQQTNANFKYESDTSRARNEAQQRSPRHKAHPRPRE